MSVVERILAVAGYTFKRHLRHRAYLTVLLFGLLLVVAAVAVSSLAAEERGRLLLDVGLAGIEFLALVSAVFLSVNLVLEELSSRAVCLLLARPLERWAYVCGRFAGTLAAVACAMAAMALLHAALLALHGALPLRLYALAWLCSLAKVAVVASAALMLSLFSTSAEASTAFTLSLWVLGHFSRELAALGRRSDSLPVRAVAWTLRHLAPDFSWFNYRDLLGASGPPALWAGSAALYAVCYGALCLYIACFLFSEREL